MPSARSPVCGAQEVPEPQWTCSNLHMLKLSLVCPCLSHCTRQYTHSSGDAARMTECHAEVSTWLVMAAPLMRGTVRPTRSAPSRTKNSVCTQHRSVGRILTHIMELPQCGTETQTSAKSMVMVVRTTVATWLIFATAGSARSYGQAQMIHKTASSEIQLEKALVSRAPSAVHTLGSSSPSMPSDGTYVRNGKMSSPQVPLKKRPATVGQMARSTAPACASGSGSHAAVSDAGDAPGTGSAASAHCGLGHDPSWRIGAHPEVRICTP